MAVNAAPNAGPATAATLTSCGMITNSGPMAAATPATIAIVFFCPSVRLVNLFARFSINPATFSTTGASTLPNAICAPSMADPIRANAPWLVLSITFAMSAALPVLLLYASLSSAVWSVCFANTNSALWADRPTSSLASARSRPWLASSLIAPDTSPPVAPRSEMMRRNAVPACEPLIPALASVPSIAVVSSRLTPAAFATGATNFIASLNVDMSNADVLKLDAITSVTRDVSSASSPNPRNVAPATSALVARSEPLAFARFNVLSVTFVISSLVKPSLANSNCNELTSDAVNEVDEPKRNASCSSALNSAPVAPDTACTLAMLASKSAATLKLLAPIPTMGAVTAAVNPAPIFLMLPSVLFTPFLACASLLFRSVTSAPMCRTASPNLAICQCF